MDREHKCRDVFQMSSLAGVAKYHQAKTTIELLVLIFLGSFETHCHLPNTTGDDMWTG